MTRRFRIRNDMSLLCFLFSMLLLGLPVIGSDPPEDGQFLFQPFEGFSDQGMAPLIQLLKSDSEGRRLLRRTLRKSKLKDLNDLKQILCFCEGGDLASGYERRGLFTQSSAYFYRAIGRDNWEDGGTGELAKLNQPKVHVILARKEYRTDNFEHLEVAFRPKICLKQGMSLLQTYLVLYHELIHLVDLNHFDRLDLFTFTTHNKRSRFYYQQLAKKGGELEAYVGQLKAFQRLKKRYDIPERWVLEGFLNPSGNLDYRNREAFMDHLLDKAGYREHLDTYLSQQLLTQYNRSYAWWAYMEKLIDNLDQNMAIIEGNLVKINDNIRKWETANRTVPDELTKARREWLLVGRNNRSEHKSYRAELLELERFMERVDRYHPRQQP